MVLLGFNLGAGIYRNILTLSCPLVCKIYTCPNPLASKLECIHLNRDEVDKDSNCGLWDLEAEENIWLLKKSFRPTP